MYRYTISPHMRALYTKAQHKGWCKHQNCSYVFALVREYAPSMNLPKANVVWLFEQCMNVVYFSKTQLRKVPVCGVAIPVNFFVETKI